MWPLHAERRSLRGRLFLAWLAMLAMSCGAEAGPASTAAADGVDPGADQSSTAGGDAMGATDIAAGDGEVGGDATGHAPDGAPIADIPLVSDAGPKVDIACAGPELCNNKDDDCDGQTDEEAACDDGDPCTIGELCKAGSCTAGSANPCEPLSDCSKGSCDPAKGCVFTAIPGPCDDGSACTKNDACANGFCVGDWLTCDDGDPCTNDTCDTVKGCAHQVVPNEVPCGDKKVCIAGKCVADGTLYAHTSSQLYKLDLKTKSFALVGKFSFDKSAGSVTDIALNRTQTLYAVTFNNLFTCATANATCKWLMSLPTSFNGMTFVPIGTVYKDKEALIGIANNGGWYRVDYQAAKPGLKLLGSYGAGYSSSGDAFSVLGVGTFATVKAPGVSGDALVKVDPKTGKVIQNLGAIGASNLYGFAWWDGVFYGFASSGQVWDINVTTGKGKLLSGFNIPKVSWWGAGVSTEAGP